MEDPEDLYARWCERVREAAATGGALSLLGGGSKQFYGREPVGEPLALAANRGVLSYEPTELVVTVRGGTPLVELEALLAGQDQMLAFEPPYFGPEATVAGCVAAGLSGPGRQGAGPLRDYVLGVGLIDGRGRRLRFGGQVMKNVAGYDIARLMAGSLGTLGLLLEVSLKVMPRPRAIATLQFEMTADDAITTLNAWAARPLPIQASAWTGGVLSLRLAGAEAAVAAAIGQLGGVRLSETLAVTLWQRVREQQLPAQQGRGVLWRIAVPSNTPALDFLPGLQVMEWGGGLRWWRDHDGVMAASSLRETLAERGGHACQFRDGVRQGPVFHPLPPALFALHRRLKAAFDPAGLFNPGRLYEGL